LVSFELKANSVNVINDVEKRLHHAVTLLSTKRAAILRRILSSSEETFHLSARQLAKRYEVDPATITRLVRDIGYESFAAFSVDLRAFFIRTVTPLQTFKEDISGFRSEWETIKLSFTRASENIKDAGQGLASDAFVAMCRKLMEARRIIIIGGDMLYSVGFHLSYGLALLGVSANAPQQNVTMTYAARNLGPEDVLVVLGYRKTLKISAETAALGRQQGAYVLGITDHKDSLIGRAADYALIAPITSPAFTGSLSAPMAIVEAILMGCAYVSQPRSLQLLQMIDEDYRNGERWFKDDLESYLNHLPPKRK
jgi:DNA-binding MurR/RpiR family transcriptional regulator